MAENYGASSGGIHPGKPMIWPSSKQSQQVAPQQTQTAGGVRNVPSQATPAAAVGTPAQAAAPTSTAATAVAANVARAFTLEDLRSNLLNLQIPDTDLNVSLAQMMLKHGLELSRSNFAKLMGMMEGTNMGQSVQEAAMALMLKGVDSPEALRILSNHFAKDPNLAAQILALQESIGNLQGALGAGRAALNSSLISQIGAMLSQFDDLLKGLPGKFKFTGNGSVGRDGLISDVRALKALLSGVQDKASAEGAKQSDVLGSSLSTALNRLDSVLENLVKQTVMSQGSDRQEMNYLFYQIPNSLANPPKNLEIMISKDPNDQKTVDPADTKVIMSIETHNMGKLSMVMRVKDNKVRLLFNTENDEVQNLFVKESGALMQKLLEKDYIAEGLQVKVNPRMCNIRPYLIPLMGLDDLLRINVEA